MRFVYNDGGRAAAGYKGLAGDCVTRAVAIATGLSYQSAYELVDAASLSERLTKRRRSKSSARLGVHKDTTRNVMALLGWQWVPTMQIGQGCETHLRPDELPSGRLIVQVSKHTCAVIDGVIHDTHDPSRNGTRCVYGFWHRS